MAGPLDGWRVLVTGAVVPVLSAPAEVNAVEYAAMSVQRSA